MALGFKDAKIDVGAPKIILILDENNRVILSSRSAREVAEFLAHISIYTLLAFSSGKKIFKLVTVDESDIGGKLPGVSSVFAHRPRSVTEFDIFSIEEITQNESMKTARINPVSGSESEKEHGILSGITSNMILSLTAFYGIKYGHDFEGIEEQGMEKCLQVVRQIFMENQRCSYEESIKKTLWFREMIDEEAIISTRQTQTVH